MKHKFSILYSWFIRTITFFLPNIPILMRFRGFLYSIMMKECGKNFQVTSSAIIVSLSGIKIGNDVYIGSNTVIIAMGLKIEDEVLVGPNCVITDGKHTFKDKSFRFGKSKRTPVKISKGSWVTGNCTITSGSILPERSILAAGAVLNKQFEIKEGLYGGIPAKYLKKVKIK